MTHGRTSRGVRDRRASPAAERRSTFYAQGHKGGVITAQRCNSPEMSNVFTGSWPPQGCCHGVGAQNRRSATSAAPDRATTTHVGRQVSRQAGRVHGLLHPLGHESASYRTAWASACLMALSSHLRVAGLASVHVILRVQAGAHTCGE